MPSVSRLAELTGQINAALPQTQCTRCGYPDCAAYAGAIAEGTAAINQCPPGGAEGIARLARITGKDVLPLNTAHGVEAPRTTVFIDEAWCIGCTLCIKACPTDAIVGSNKWMHTVMEQYCTGCELCVPVCPVDCIQVESASGVLTGWAAWSDAQAKQARSRYAQRKDRLRREALTENNQAAPTEADARREESGPGADSAQVPATSLDAASTPQNAGVAARRAAIAAALERARQQRAAGKR
ncbi:electron transport complex subunit RsxB [Acidovorax sp. RAC01]|mgnify:CR=1 FL=1|uniref:electron transport complex subunit RsxB n=1 Tax=Acidovorax sp. RAC01 TaxID=1842533 RepID=UPI00083E70CD|nr:electron transport complex subunit RsxB [Acidovorax sp. RAC01]AOG24050.1 electron transport complex, RnfABCDGE type, B subunit [Acidovorax sp. RAC01]